MSRLKNAIKIGLMRFRKTAAERADVIVFNHIPKTAGMSFHAFLEDNLPQGSIAEFYTADNRDRLVALTDEERVRIQAVVGHLPFVFFQGSRARFPKPFAYCTFLRSPVDRIVSYYRHILRDPQHYLHNRMLSEKMSLAAFVAAKENVELDNLQTRYLCTTDCSNVAFGGVNDKMLSEAKDNLKRNFAFIGLQEEFDQSLKLAAHALNLKRVRSHQINRARNAAPPADRKDVEMIVSLNEFDMQLYEFAKRLFQAHINKI